MLRHGIKRLAQLTASNAGSASSLEAVASSSICRGDAAQVWAQAASTSWNPLGWKWHSTETGGEGPSSKEKSSSLGRDPTPVGVRPKGVAAASADTAGPVTSIADADAALDAWGAAMDQGDWESAWDIFESQFPVGGPEFPELEELLAWDPDADDKAGRRQREEARQEEIVKARVRQVDGQGRAHGVGKRKTSVARVWLREGPGHFMVNRRPYDAYFPSLPRRNDLLAPFFVTETLGRFDVMAAVQGGGPTGQAQALRHGIARALQNWDPEMRASLKVAGLLTRDARIVERKKPGLKKARKAFQWVKR